ncbi:MAG: HDOD domain-containing protein [Syntrophaceae bacterium]|nr:HDOD domain-containing protein [Syntrophaceae bacterium]
MISPQELISKVNGSDIASIRRILNRIIEVALDPHSNAVDLKNLIEADPPLTAKILRRANSAYYGMPRKVSDILDAIMFIGFDSVKELSISQAVADLFQSSEISHGQYSRNTLWVHCVAVASCGKLIARRELRKNGNDIYTAGLLHDIGLIVIDQFLRDDFLSMIKAMERQQSDIWQAEEDTFRFCHDEVGGSLLKEWNFPDNLSCAVHQAERPKEVQIDEHEETAVLHIAHFCCQERKLGYLEPMPQDALLYQRCLNKFGIEERAIEFIMDDVEEQIRQMVEHGWF